MHSVSVLKVENDGFDLGAQRRKIDKNDLPKALEEINEWKKNVGNRREQKFLFPTMAISVKKEKIAENGLSACGNAQAGDYNLTGDRYREVVDYSNAKWEMVELGEVCDIKTGKKDVNQGNPDGEYPFFTCAKEHTFSDSYSFDTEALLIAGNGDVGAVKYYKGKFEAYQRTYTKFI